MNEDGSKKGGGVAHVQRSEVGLLASDAWGVAQPPGDLQLPQQEDKMPQGQASMSVKSLLAEQHKGSLIIMNNDERRVSTCLPGHQAI